jgi:DNA-binding NarL/FixJ family response regulator
MKPSTLPNPLLVALVEDNDNDRNELLRQIYQMKRCRLEYARHDYNSFFEDSDEWSYRDYNPHVMLIDLSLGRGKKTGFAVIDTLKKQSHCPKIIVITGDTGNVYLEESESKGVNAVIRKSLLAGADAGFLETILVKVYENTTKECLLFLGESQKHHLTDREKAVVKARINGLSYDQISDKTGVSKVAIMFKKLRDSFAVGTNEALITQIQNLRLLE